MQGSDLEYTIEYIVHWTNMFAGNNTTRRGGAGHTKKS